MPDRSSHPAAPPTPVLRVTAYEQVSSGLMAIIAALVAAVVLLSGVWFASRAPKAPVAVPVEMIEISGGVDDGSIEDSLRVDSPEPADPQATPAEIESEDRETQESLDNVLELADEAATQTERQFEQGTRNTGKAASATGTGRRALGSGSGQKGFPREQRWYIRFGDQQSIDEYARQLDFFGIEFGAIVDGKLVYLSNFSAPRPQMRSASSGSGEARLYMTWQGGGRKQADLQLFKKAGIDVGTGALFQFYPKPTEDQLARLEVDYRKRRVEEIRRTYFTVAPADKGYKFSVIRQTYLK